MKRISLIVCAVLGIAGCGKSVPTDVVVIDDDDAVEVAFEDVATDIRIVPLISDEPIGGCSELHCYGNEVFMSDKSTEYLYYFVDGKLVSTLHSVGRAFRRVYRNHPLLLFARQETTVYQCYRSSRCHCDIALHHEVLCS